MVLRQSRAQGIRDAAATGATKTTIVCGTTPGQCTAGTTPTIGQIQSAAGYALPAIASGQTYQLAITVNVTRAAGATIANVATIATPTGITETVLGDNSATDSNSIYQSPLITMRKTSTGATATFAYTVTNADTNLAVSGVQSGFSITTATPGTAVTYDADTGLGGNQRITVIALNNPVVFTETPIAGFVVTAASACIQTAGTAATLLTDTSAGTLTITPPPGGFSAGSVFICDYLNAAVADLAIVKTNGETSLISGNTTTYTLTITNNGAIPVTGARVTDTVVSGLTCAPGNALPSLATASLREVLPSAI